MKRSDYIAIVLTMSLVSQNDHFALFVLMGS